MMMTFRVRLEKAGKPTQPRLRFDLEKLRVQEIACTFEATTDGEFAPPIGLKDERVDKKSLRSLDIDTMMTTYNTAMTDTDSEILAQEHRRKKPWFTKDVVDLCNERRDLKKGLYEAEGTLCHQDSYQ